MTQEEVRIVIPAFSSIEFATNLEIKKKIKKNKKIILTASKL